MQYIEFEVEGEHYAVPISDIHEIIKMQEITEIPNGPRYVQGVIQLRGSIIPVISLRRLFSLQKDEYTKMTRIIVVSHKEELAGFIVDKVNQVKVLTEIQPPPYKTSSASGNYFTGIGLSDDRLVGILKLDEVLL